MESLSLDLLHSVQLDLLVEFDRICEDNGLSYFLDSGSALGAVRHHGFIPWDDDVDVGMPRDDYDKLLEIGTKGFPGNLFLQTYETDPNYPMPFAKIRLGGTFFPEKGNSFNKLKYQGIYIDVFLFDKVPDNPKKAERRIRFSRFWYFVSVFSQRDYPGKKPLQWLLSFLLHHLPGKSITELHKYYDCFCTKYNSIDTGILTCFCWRISQRGTYLFNEFELFPTKTIEFEGKRLRIMNSAHVYLTKVYGNYAVLPPEEERKSHLVGSFKI